MPITRRDMWALPKRSPTARVDVPRGRRIKGVYVSDHMRCAPQYAMRCRFHGMNKRHRGRRCAVFVHLGLRGEGGPRRECGEPLERVPKL